jgi:YVTN family beta-propeller protein
MTETRRTAGLLTAWLACLTVGTLCVRGEAAGGEPPGSEPAPVRFGQPVALAFSRDGARLLVANRRSGSLSEVDTATSRVVAEHDVGRGLADVAALPDGKHWLAVDRAADAVLLVETGGEGEHRARVVARRAVSPDPARVAVLPDGSAVVASAAARRLTGLGPVAAGDDVQGRPALDVAWVLDLPFSPLEMVPVRGGSRLVVADAFGGKVAVVAPDRGAVEAVHALPAHNIRGLAVSPDGASVVLAHQSLRRLARATYEDVHWGSLVNNHLRVLRVDALLGGGTTADILRSGRLIDLGSPGSAAGDPAGIAFGRAGGFGFAVAVAGTDEVFLGPGPTSHLRRVEAGRRPSAVAFSPDGKTLVAADALDDALTVIDAAAGIWLRTVSLGPRPEPTAADRGERLFYSAKLAHDGWMSCHSCHTDGQSNGLLADTLGDGSYGAPKRVPSLLGVGTTGPWAWNGSVERLEDQVRKSVELTMYGSPPSADQVADLTAFLRSLPPPRPGEAPAEAVARGRAVFESRGCVKCHAPPDYTTPARYDVGLADESGDRRFNPPSLRGVGRREPLFHDGRAATLDDVFRRHQHPRDLALPAGEVDDLIAFLKTL